MILFSYFADVACRLSKRSILRQSRSVDRGLLVRQNHGTGPVLINVHPTAASTEQQTMTHRRVVVKRIKLLRRNHQLITKLLAGLVLLKTTDTMHICSRGTSSRRERTYALYEIKKIQLARRDRRLCSGRPQSGAEKFQMGSNATRTMASKANTSAMSEQRTRDHHQEPREVSRRDRNEVHTQAVPDCSQDLENRNNPKA